MLETGSVANISGGSVGDDFDVTAGSVLNINGGTVGNQVQARSGSVVNISGGEVGRNFQAFADSVINVSGGNIESSFNAQGGSVVNVSGGKIDRISVGRDAELNLTGGILGSNSSVGEGVVNISGGIIDSFYLAFAGSEVNIAGGVVRENFSAGFGGGVTNINISGGAIGDGFDAGFSNHNVNISGGDFRLNGNAITGSTLALDPNSNDVFTGTLADGSAFIFTPLAGDDLVNVTLTQAPTLGLADSTPIIVTAPRSGPSGLRAGQSLTLQSGGELGENFSVVEATLNVEQGIVGDGFEAHDSNVNISGGEFERVFFSQSDVVFSGGLVTRPVRAFSDTNIDVVGGNVASTIELFESTLNVNSGSVSGIDATDNSIANINGGTVVNGVTVAEDSIFNLNAGEVSGTFFNAFGEVNFNGGTFSSTRSSFGGTVNIFGGSFEGEFDALNNSAINLFGSEFFLDGVLLDTFDIGESLVITDRNRLLSGLLADGSEFEFELNDSFSNNEGDFFASGSTLTLTLLESNAVPEPSGTVVLALAGLTLLQRRKRSADGR